MKKGNNNKSAFTLAETLITLGIIGVVAALTIPGLITAHKKHVISTSLKRAVSEINQVVKQSEAENGEMETWDKSEGQLAYINKYIRPYIKITHTCETAMECGYKSERAVWSIYRENYSYTMSPTYSGRIPFISSNGILYVFAFRTDGGEEVNNNNKLIMIDINNAKEPNEIGQDVFFLYRNEETDSIIPYGAHEPNLDVENCNDETSNSTKIFYCAAWIYQNGWNLPTNYIIK